MEYMDVVCIKCASQHNTTLSPTNDSVCYTYRDEIQQKKEQAVKKPSRTEKRFEKQQHAHTKTPRHWKKDKKNGIGTMVHNDFQRTIEEKFREKKNDRLKRWNLRSRMLFSFTCTTTITITKCERKRCIRIYSALLFAKFYNGKYIYTIHIYSIHF